MKWSPGQCRKGDIVRVALGSLYHYGVFVSEDEIIQFGYPPLPEFAEQNKEPRVCAVDADTFCCGRIIERGEPEHGDKKTARTPDEAVQAARSRLGEGGYSIIHNNCEHFARECVLGVRMCEQEAEMRRKWQQRGILDVFIARIPDGAEPGPIADPNRAAYVAGTADEKLRIARYCVWELLGTALRRCAGVDFPSLRFTRAINGKWSSDGAPPFSLSHTKSSVCVAVSDGAVGVDIEENDAFDRFGDPKLVTSRLLCHGERADGRDGILSVWTKKESIFKQTSGTVFEPRGIRLKKHDTVTFRLPGFEDLTVSVCGRTSALRCYVCEGGTVRGVTPVRI